MAIAKPTKPNTYAAGIAYAADVNENEDTLYSKLDEVIDSINAADGSKSSLATRLDVSLNDDGTLKTAATAGGEWINPDLTLLYVSGTSFTVDGDQTDIYTALRRIKATLAASTVYSQVISSEYAAGTGLTTVVIADDVLADPLTSIEHGVISALAAEGSVTPAMLGAATTEALAAVSAVADAALPSASYTDASVLSKVAAASATAAGKVELATDAETQAGTDTERAITPANLTARTATDARTGIVELATAAEFATGTDTARVLTVDVARDGNIILDTPQATTSGTAITFSPPAWAKEVNIFFMGVSLSGADGFLMRIGTETVEETGYAGTVGTIVTGADLETNSTAFKLIASGASGARTFSGKLTISQADATANTWILDGKLTVDGAAQQYFSVGKKTIAAGALGIVTVLPSGSNTYDGGSINATYK